VPGQRPSRPVRDVPRSPPSDVLSAWSRVRIGSRCLKGFVLLSLYQTHGLRLPVYRRTQLAQGFCCAPTSAAISQLNSVMPTSQA